MQARYQATLRPEQENGQKAQCFPATQVHFLVRYMFPYWDKLW
jgi:hypothetical protein